MSGWYGERGAGLAPRGWGTCMPRRYRMNPTDQALVVIGLGYVGLPLAVAFADAGVQVTGLEIDEERVRAITHCQSYIGDVPSERLGKVIQAGRLTATTDPRCLQTATAIIICVPTPLTEHHMP